MLFHNSIIHNIKMSKLESSEHIKGMESSEHIKGTKRKHDVDETDLLNMTVKRQKVIAVDSQLMCSLPDELQVLILEFAFDTPNQWCAYQEAVGHTSHYFLQAFLSHFGVPFEWFLKISPLIGCKSCGSIVCLENISSRNGNKTRPGCRPSVVSRLDASNIYQLTYADMSELKEISEPYVGRGVNRREVIDLALAVHSGWEGLYKTLITSMERQALKLKWAKEQHMPSMLYYLKRHGLTEKQQQVFVKHAEQSSEVWNYYVRPARLCEHLNKMFPGWDEETALGSENLTIQTIEKTFQQKLWCHDLPYANYHEQQHPDHISIDELHRRRNLILSLKPYPHPRLYIEYGRMLFQPEFNFQSLKVQTEKYCERDRREKLIQGLIRDDPYIRRVNWWQMVERETFNDDEVAAELKLQAEGVRQRWLRSIWIRKLLRGHLRNQRFTRTDIETWTNRDPFDEKVIASEIKAEIVRRVELDRRRDLLLAQIPSDIVFSERRRLMVLIDDGITDPSFQDADACQWIREQLMD